MRNVQVILREDVASLGHAGDLVNVKPGFARNFLIPQGKAIVATEASKRELAHQQRVIAERVQREVELLEAERKKIEAQGIADFQNIVTAGISQNLLRWKGIEATEKLAASANAKVIVIGGADGLPLILNTQ